jgi:putative integral membrane protein (TIGR02587 family)
MGSASDAHDRNSRFIRGLGRAIAGAIIFGLPLLMTMEMWRLGVYMPAWKLALLLVLFFPFLVVLSWHSGFEPTFSWRDDVVDALVAYAVGFVASLLVLWLLGLLGPGMSLREMAGKVVLQALPASIGALLAQSQLGEREETQVTRGGVAHYGSELFVMGVGALFLAFNLAPTEEMLLLAVSMPAWVAALLMLVSLMAMHAFVYGVAFRGRPDPQRRPSGWHLWLRFTVVGYAIALLLSAFMLWAFGRFEGASLAMGLQAVAVLGFPAAIGAAAARLIL